MTSALDLAVEFQRELLAPGVGDYSSGAVFSSSDIATARWRFMLWRTWDDSLPPLVWCMLNPSTATHDVDDATIRRCIGWSRMWCFGGIVIVNAYAHRSTDPEEMLRAPGRVGLGNDHVLRRVLSWVRETPTPEVLPPQRVMVAWGDRIEPAREQQMIDLLLEVGGATHCLGRTQRGNPRHPVRLPYDTIVRSWP